MFDIILTYILGVSFVTFGVAPYMAESKYPKLEFIGICLIWIVIITVLWY